MPTMSQLRSHTGLSSRLRRSLSFLVLGIVSTLILAPNLSQAQPAEVPPCEEGFGLPEEAHVPCSAILTFKEGLNGAERAAAVQRAGAGLNFNYYRVNAAAVNVPSAAAQAALASDPDVTAVIPNRIVQATKKPDNPGGGNGNNGGGDNSGQVTPSGVARIGAAPGSLPHTGAGIGVAIADTGLDFGHSDLNVAPECFTAYSSCQDGDGHGTHVGGIVAALDNEQDTVGVAPDATLYAVKVLADNGFGSDASIMAGMEWIADNADSVSPPIQVVNVSLGREGSLNDNPALRESIRVLTEDLGISVIVAAGNDQGLEVADNVPATYPEVMAVASTTAADGNNQCRQFSGIIPADTASFFTTDGILDNNGIGVTISAPGAQQENIKKSCFIQSSGILSLRAGGGTTRMSGTSMATPHVTGVVALMAEDNGGSIDPEVARSDIRGTADAVGVAPLDSPTSSYTFDGEREGVISACGVLGVSCP